MKNIKIKQGVYINYDYINLTMFYGRICVNLYFIPSKGCRDRIKISRIVSSNDSIVNIEKELAKIGYKLLEKTSYEPNIHYYYIFKNTKQSNSLYNYKYDDDGNEIKSFKIKINDDTNKLDLSDLD